MFSRNRIYPLRLDEELFPHISVISGHQNHISRPMSNIFKLKELNRQEKISFGDMPSPNIPSLTLLLGKFSEKIG